MPAVNLPPYFFFFFPFPVWWYAFLEILEEKKILQHVVGPQFNSSSQFLFNHQITAGSEPISLDQRDQPLPSAFPSHFHIAAAQNSTIDVVFVCSFKVSHRLGTRMGFEFLVSCIALQKSFNFSLFCKAVFIKQFLF